MSAAKSFGVYFAYHQEFDGERADIVMSHSATREADVASIWTQAIWDDALVKGVDYAKSKIAEAIEGVGVTCLLIGERTFERPWIRTVLEMSHDSGKGIFAVYIHTIPDLSGRLTKKGPNPLGRLKYTGRGGGEYPFASYYFTYDWKLHQGPERFNLWVDIARKQVSEEEWRS